MIFFHHLIVCLHFDKAFHSDYSYLLFDIVLKLEICFYKKDTQRSVLWVKVHCKGTDMGTSTISTLFFYTSIKEHLSYACWNLQTGKKHASASSSYPCFFHLVWRQWRRLSGAFYVTFVMSIIEICRFKSFIQASFWHYFYCYFSGSLWEDDLLILKLACKSLIGSVVFPIVETAVVAFPPFSKRV